MPPLRVYSPSQTGDWLQCPVLRRLRRSWRERVVIWEPAMLLGNAVQAGMNVWLRAIDMGVPLDDAIEAAVVDVIAQGYEDQPKYTREGLVKLTLRGVQALLDADLFRRHTILMVDEPLGHSRPDVVSRHESEGLGVTDFKVTMALRDDYRASRLSGYSTDDQFWHYAWEVGETLGEPVKWIRPMVVILAPKPTVLHDLIAVESSRLHFWLSGAEQHWKDMQAEDEGTRPVVPRWPNCRNAPKRKGGICEMHDACHVLNRDPAQMAVYYERVEC